MNHEHDPIEQLLRADARRLRQTYIDNAGFSERVFTALPVRQRVSRTTRMLLPMGMAALAMALVFMFAGGTNFAIDVGIDIITKSFTREVAAFLAIAAAFVVACAVSLRELD